ncbi:hypothetical protein PQX77_002722 [Marasmius sp. AFHP31]|nr:hypothetical protein PQX77_002722 [Marasmius sp. AFHP31]
MEDFATYGPPKIANRSKDWDDIENGLGEAEEEPKSEEGWVQQSRRWNNIRYILPGAKGWLNRKKGTQEASSNKVILDGMSGRVVPGQMMAIWAQ